MLPVFDAGAVVVATGQGLLPFAAGFFRTTRDPIAPPPPSVPTLLCQLSTLALFTPPAEVPCENTQLEKNLPFPVHMDSEKVWVFGGFFSLQYEI